MYEWKELGQCESVSVLISLESSAEMAELEAEFPANIQQLMDDMSGGLTAKRLGKASEEDVVAEPR